MIKTLIKDVTILSIFDFYKNEKIFLGKTIFGICVQDETNRFGIDDRIITSLIKSQNKLEFITKRDNYYVAEHEPEHLEIKLSELVVMRHLLFSPAEVIEAREKLEREDTKRLH